MVSNVYTKSEILQKLAAKGYFIDTYTLDTFMKKWKVEAIFEDEQGAEFFDKNALDLILTNLFNAQSQQEQENKKEDLKEEILKGIKQEIDTVKAQQDAQFQKQFEAISKQKEKEQKNVFSVDGLDNATLEAISGVKLSDGSNLSQKIQDINSISNEVVEQLTSKSSKED